MATIGLSKPYYALYSESNGVVTYSEAAAIGKAVELSVELEGGDANVLYADNGPAESDNVFSGGTITLTTDDLLAEPMMGILGIENTPISEVSGVTTEGASWMIFDDRQSTPYVGFGAIMKKRQSNATKWVVIAFPKIQFQNPGDSAVTQGETVEWQTPELTATIMRDDTANHEWKRVSSPLDSEAEALALLQDFLGASAG